MALRKSVVTLTTKVLDSIRDALAQNTHDLVLGLATSIEDEYRKNAPRDTGSLAESTYVQMRDSAYQHGQKTSVGAIEAKAKALNPDATIAPLPTPTDRTIAYVAPLTGHFNYVEYGTTRRAARPIMAQARAKVRSELKSKHKDLLLRVVTNGHR